MRSLQFPNYGVVSSKLEAEQIRVLKEAANKLYKSNNPVSASDTLVGHVDKEYYFIEEIKPFQKEIFSCLHHYALEFPDYFENYMRVDHKDLASLEFVLDKVWINFQKKYDFNPVHIHSGVFSFVIWLDIPFLLSEERKVFNGETKTSTSEFSFLYSDILGRIQTYNLNLEAPSEGTICLFPSHLPHVVYPFYTSEKNRISISGNIRVDPRNESTINEIK